MSKKYIALMAVICTFLAGGIAYMRMQADHQGPEIVYSNDTVSEYDSDMTDEELLEGVSASDDKDGDVSDSLKVESIYEVDDSHVIITYVAKDNSNNITKAKRNLEMRQKEDGFDDIDIQPTQIPVKDAEMDETSQFVSDVENTENSRNETNQTEGTDLDTAEQMKKEQEALADEMPSQNPRLYLTDYYIEVPIGTSIDLLSYVKNISDDKDDVYTLWRKIQISGEVNTSVEGTYTCTYYVLDSDNNSSNSAVLTVKVK